MTLLEAVKEVKSSKLVIIDIYFNTLRSAEPKVVEWLSGTPNEVLKDIEGVENSEVLEIETSNGKTSILVKAV